MIDSPLVNDDSFLDSSQSLVFGNSSNQITHTVIIPGFINNNNPSAINNIPSTINNLNTSAKLITKTNTSAKRVFPLPSEPFIVRDGIASKGGYIVPPMPLGCKRTPKTDDMTQDNISDYMDWLFTLLHIDGCIGETRAININAYLDDFVGDLENKRRDAKFRNTIKDLVKNLHCNSFAKDDAKRLHNNQVQNRYRQQLKRDGICKDCHQPIVDDPEFEEENCSTVRCFVCHLKKLHLSREAYRAIRDAGVHCPMHKSVPLNSDNCCMVCAKEYLVKLAKCLVACNDLGGNGSSSNSSNSNTNGNTPFNVQCTECGIKMENEFESIGFSIHHVLYGKDKKTDRTFHHSLQFLNALAKHGKNHFLNLEPCKVYCRSCHANLHARDVNTISRFGDRTYILKYFGNKCNKCQIHSNQLTGTSLLYSSRST